MPNVKNKFAYKNRLTLSFTPPETPVNAFDIVIVDTVGPLLKSENSNEFIVTLICDLTKYLVAIPIKSKSANNVAKAIFENFILKFGPMKTFISDMVTEYKNQIFIYHHKQTLGTIERSHRTFNEYIRSYISADKID